jgi:hypothetical protein
MNEIQRLKKQLKIALEALEWYDNNGVLGYKDMNLKYDHFVYLSGQKAHDALRDIYQVPLSEWPTFRGKSLKEYIDEKNS